MFLMARLFNRTDLSLQIYDAYGKPMCEIPVAGYFDVSCCFAKRDPMIQRMLREGRLEVECVGVRASDPHLVIPDNDSHGLSVYVRNG